MLKSEQSKSPAVGPAGDYGNTGNSVDTEQFDDTIISEPPQNVNDLNGFLTNKQAISIEDFDVGFAKLRVEKTRDCVIKNQIPTQLNMPKPSMGAGSGAGITGPFMGNPIGPAPCPPPVAGVVAPAHSTLDSITDARAFLDKHREWKDLDYDMQNEFLEIGVNSKIYNRTLDRYFDCNHNHTMRAQKHDDIKFSTYFRHLSGQSLVLGFDTEWYEEDEIKIENKKRCTYKKRIPLSAQFSTTIDEIRYDFIFYANGDLSLGSCLYYIVNIYFKGFGLCLSHKGRSHHKYLTFDSSKITLVGHFSGVDLSMFSDFNKLFGYASPTAKELTKIKGLKQKLLSLDEDDRDEKKKDRDRRILLERLEKLEKHIRHATNVIVQNKHIVFTTSDRILTVRIHNNLLCEFRLCLRDTMALSSDKSRLVNVAV